MAPDSNPEPSKNEIPADIATFKCNSGEWIAKVLVMAKLCESTSQARRDIRAGALKINQQYELSKEFWAYCVKVGILKEPRTFINPVPHLSFVVDHIVPYLKQRYETLKTSPLFANMYYSEDREQIKQWAPLLLEGLSQKSNFQGGRNV